MADNTTLNTGTGGDVIAADDIGGAKYQRVKLTLGADGTNDGDLASGNPLPTSGRIVVVSGTFTLPTSSIYAINDALSNSTSAPTAGGFTLADAGRQSGKGGVILDAIVTSSVDAATLLQGEIWLFSQAVTAINDNAAFAVSDAEINTCLGKIPFTLEDAGNNGFYHAQNLNIGYVCVGSANLRYLVRAKNAYTPATDVLNFSFKCLQID